jgi:hypothetical protein
MKHILVVLMVLAALIMPALGEKPSDKIVTAPLPGKISLSGTVDESMKAIDDMNEPLGMWQRWEVPNIGHYTSWKVDVVQEDSVGVPTALLNFSQQKPVDLNMTSVGNLSADFTVLDSTSTEGLVFT